MRDLLCAAGGVKRDADNDENDAEHGEGSDQFHRLLAKGGVESNADDHEHDGEEEDALEKLHAYSLPI